MPVTCEFRGSILIATLIGECGDEATTAIDTAMADRSFAPGMALLIDVRVCTDQPLSEDFRRWATSLGQRKSKGLSSRYAIVIGPRTCQYGLARMASAYADLSGMDMGIFTDLDEPCVGSSRLNQNLWRTLSNDSSRLISWRHPNS